MKENRFGPTEPLILRHEIPPMCDIFLWNAGCMLGDFKKDPKYLETLTRNIKEGKIPEPWRREFTEYLKGIVPDELRRELFPLEVVWKNPNYKLDEKPVQKPVLWLVK